MINSFKYAFNGIKYALKEEKNMLIHISIMLLVIMAGIILKISLTEWFVSIILFGLVISSEIFNTSIENLVDIVEPKKCEQVKKVKDLAAGAVLVNAICAFIIGCIIFVPKILILLNII